MATGSIPLPQSTATRMVGSSSGGLSPGSRLVDPRGSGHAGRTAAPPVEPGRRQDPPVGGRRRWAAVCALAAAALCLAIAGCASPPEIGDRPTPVASNNPGTPSSPRAPVASDRLTPSERPATTGPGNPVPAPTPRALAPGEEDWGRLPFASGLRDPYGGSHLVAVAAGRAGFVAVGASPMGGAAWTSADGLTWRRADTGPLWAGAALTDVAATSSGYVAVGVLVGPDGERLGGAAWTSGDGMAWALAARDLGMGLDRVAAGDGTLYALEVEGGSRAWRSGDGGQTWAPIAGLPEMDLNTIAVGPHGIVVGGSTWLGEGDWQAALALSTDGRTWTAAAIPPSRGEIRDVAWAGDRWVAVGAAEGDVGAAWASEDGRAWTRAPASEVFAANDRGVYLSAVAATGDGRFVAVGPGPDGHAGFWFSDDGLAWSLAPTPERVREHVGKYEPIDVVAKGGRIVAVGSYPDRPRAWSAAVWTNRGPPTTSLPSPSPASCPARRPDLMQLVDLPAARRLDCYGTEQVIVRAFVAAAFLEGGDPPPEPAWLTSANWCAHPIEARGSYCFEIHVGPGSGVETRLPDRDGAGRWLWVTGRFGDSAAASCPAEIREPCRQAFVVQEVSAASAPAEGNP